MVEVAAAIIEKEGKILVCKRGPGGCCAYLWEFPGGKLEEGETPLEAVKRECYEELNINIVPLKMFMEYPFHYPDSDIYFYFIKAAFGEGEILLNVHEDLKWITPYEMEPEKFCPADRDIISKLKVEYVP